MTNNINLKNDEESMGSSSLEELKTGFASELSPILSLTMGQLNEYVKMIDSRLSILPSIEVAGNCLYFCLDEKRNLVLPLASDFPFGDEVFMDFLLIHKLDKTNIIEFFETLIKEKYELEFGKIPNASIGALLDNIYRKYMKNNKS
ncbi:MAG: hypothetical protein V3575_06400 [Candidatus Absconditabacteria bacterium]